MTELINFFKGVLVVRLISNTPERFLNICNANRIKMWDLQLKDENYCFKIFPAEYYRLKNILKKTASKTVITEKHGLPFLLFRYRKHNCFAAGILLAFFMLYIISLFVWDISVEGNVMVTDDVILDALKQEGIRHGMFLNRISCDELEKYLRNTFDDLTWVSVEINGTRLIIHVKENDEDFVIIRDNKECDLTASRNGVIHSIITRSGTPLVHVGDEVAEGEVLVSGRVFVYDDYGTAISEKEVCADADILIETVYEYEDVLKMKYTYKIFTGKTKKFLYVKIFDAMVRIGWNPEYDNYETLLTDDQIKISENFYLPVHYGEITHSEYKEETAKYTEQEAQKILNDRLSYFLEDLEEKGVQIIQKDVKMYKDAYRYTYSGTISVIEPAYIQTDIKVSDEDIGDLNERN
ncbi:MAG: sporulation protein YqfD [Thermoflexaceae bacterium]|nr:sporulation protein YqfD [Thermoflexaceae bacterium]